MSDFDNSKQEVIQNRRGFLAQATEIVSAVPLAALAVANWHRQDQYQTLNLEGARLPEVPLAQNEFVSKAFASQAKFMDAAEQLESSYRASYHKSTTVMVPVSNGKTITMRPQTTWYWKVPDGLPEHTEVEAWHRAEDRTRSNTQRITAGNLIDMEQLQKVAIETKTGDEASRHILTALVYGGSIGMLWGYEEALAFASAKTNDTSYHHERYEKTTATQETRRGFIKIGAAIAGTIAASLVASKIKARLDSGTDRLESEIDGAEQLAREDGAVAVSRFFGESPAATLARVQGEVARAERALLSGKADQRVTNSLSEFVRTGSDYVSQLTGIVESDDESSKLAFLVKCATGTEKLEAADSVDERIATTSALLEGLGIVGVMSLVVVPGRILNQKFPGEKNLY